MSKPVIKFYRSAEFDKPKKPRKCKVCKAAPGLCFHGWQYDMANKVIEESRACTHGTGHGVSEHVQLRNTIANALVKARALPRR